ncbi:hypothetical protein EJ110_NYTH05961 [Nymphaea thermarum]|nr:hypothetical protein EJ110_NYTH05961 [Nymphaea thermarum]
MGGNLTKGVNPSHMPKTLILGVILVRYLFMPILGVFIVKGAIKLGLVHSDPLYQFILYIQYAVPPAVNIGTITQLFGCGENESSVILLWTYLLASISITLWSTIFLWLVA